MIDPAFGNWLAGFADGEGYFMVAGRPPSDLAPRFGIGLRADDRDILDEIRDRWGIGYINRRHYTDCGSRKQFNATGYKSRPQYTLRVSKKEALVVVVETFDRFPLRTKKANDFVLWREAVALYGEPPSPSRYTSLCDLQKRIRSGREYTEEKRDTRGEGVPYPNKILVRQIPLF